ncbi:hypothetical protein AB0I61_03395 [Polymorphospora rubra]|uniref:hypothetical protein n=1 Tax=Polymorphospora rubra TaxID=338584 RepID=UPI0033DBF774
MLRHLTAVRSASLPARPRRTGGRRHHGRGRHGGGLGALLVVVALLPAGGCVRPDEAVARDQVMARAERIAAQTEAWATTRNSPPYWHGNQAVLDHILDETNGTHLASAVHDPDERGVGLLATLEVVMVTAVQTTFAAGTEVDHNVCVRFDVERQTSGPRGITATPVGCPRRIPATRAP